MLNRSEKEAIIQDLKKDIGNAKAIFLTNLIGIKSNDAVSVRKAVRDSKGKMVVTRNTLFKKSSSWNIS
jgi:large subunit ribosomal protein L10